MSKHTPGNWKFREPSQGVKWTQNIPIISECGIVVANVHSRGVSSTKRPQHKEGTANARLIAAAPALLEACKAAADFMNRVSGRGILADTDEEGRLLRAQIASGMLADTPELAMRLCAAIAEAEPEKE